MFALTNNFVGKLWEMVTWKFEIFTKITRVAANKKSIFGFPSRYFPKNTKPNFWIQKQIK